MQLPLENHVIIDFLRNAGMDTPWEAIGPKVHCLSRELRKALCEIVKCIED